MRINSQLFVNSFLELSLLSLSLSYSYKLRAFFEHSSNGKRKAKEVQERKWNQRSSKEELDQAVTTILLASIELHVWFPC